MAKRYEMDLTTGSITRNLLVFSLPFLGANLVQSLYSLVDMMMVGWFSDAGGIAGVSVGGSLSMLVNSLVSGVTMGGTVLIAQYLGAKKRDELVQIIGTMLTTFAVAAAVLTVIMLAGASGFLHLMQTPPEAFGPARDYVVICTCGMIFTFGYNAISAILRGMGDSRSPLIFITIACAANIALDALLVGGCRMGAAGAAIATVLSQALSMVLSILYLKRREFIFAFRLDNFKPHADKVRALLKLGLPISLQETMVHFSFMFITTLVNTFGVSAAAAVGIAGKFEGFAMLPATALSAAIASMAAQNIGAGLHERAYRTMKTGIAIAFGVSLIFFAWAQISPASILSIFQADAEVIEAGAAYLRAFSFDFMAVAFVFCMNGFFNSCGRTTYTMINSLAATFLVRVPMAYLLGKALGLGIFGIGLAAPLASLVSILMGIFYFRSGRWRRAQLV